jgi:hypothetical protein
MEIDLRPQVWYGYGFHCANFHETRSYSAAPVDVSNIIARYPHSEEKCRK